MVQVLSFHAAYGCRHRGRCCTSGWPIAVERSERQVLQHAIDSGRLSPAAKGAWLAGDPDAATGAALLGIDHGTCVFHDGPGGCRIQHALGHSALPLACRQFPRQSVRHPAGVSVTLSHYCPTAAGLLHTPGPVTIVTDGQGFPAQEAYIGLTADPSLPPLIHSRLAMDWDSWWLFEQLSVNLLSDAPDPLPRLQLAVERVRDWPVGDGELLSFVRESFVQARRAAVAPFAPAAGSMDAYCADAMAAVPPAWQSTAAEALSAPAGEEFGDQAWRRFVAAHAFANWNAYLGEGLRSWYRSVEAAAYLLARTNDPGRVDLILRHLADAHALVARWNHAEAAPLTGRYGGHGLEPVPIVPG